ncbi:class I SAM-dependent methyltransferase [Novosphingobium rosa]|uniref:class I SAM-dependent methyltransferase n=1 Tax=Novosphingobium rosa TaxID=76978 RepID=UPI000829BA5E|nr:class I SAM-dependent methyltransferase [Novosphingobium rosa]
MSDLLIHSMSEFSSLILEAFEVAQVRNIAEIGAEFGGMSSVLADYCGRVGGQFATIDPAPKQEFIDWVAQHPHVTHLAAPSLEVMGDLEQVDAWVIDGDHNYYTVLRELRLADSVSQRDGRPLLAFMHDVGWPWARRDSYYAPDRIPAEHRQLFSFDAGVTLGYAGSLPGRGFRSHGAYACALQAGGPGNGVLTAVEDFIAEVERDGTRQMCFANVPAVFGLGVLFDASASWGDPLAQLLGPYHDNELIRKLEINRLRNYLQVIDLQDQRAG